MVFLKLFGALLPMVITLAAGITFAQSSRSLEDRVMHLEISEGRTDERFLAIVGRLDAQD